LVIEFEDKDRPIMSGKIGFASYSNSIIDYDNVVVTGTGIPGTVESKGKLVIFWSALKQEYR